MSIYSMLSNKYGSENAKTIVIAVALFFGVFVAFSGSGDNKRAASATATESSAQASDPFAGKPWRQWSEDEMTGFMSRGLTICIKKADKKQEQDCYGVLNTIVDDWKAHHG